MKGLNVPLSYAGVRRRWEVVGRQRRPPRSAMAAACLSAGLQECSAAEADAG